MSHPTELRLYGVLRTSRRAPERRIMSLAGENPTPKRLTNSKEE
jgi:hypothetical protein